MAFKYCKLPFHRNTYILVNNSTHRLFMGTPFLALWLYNCFKPVMMIQTFFWHNSFSIFTIYGKNVKMQSVWVFISIWVYRNMSSSMVQIKISSKLLRWETMMIYREALESWIQKSCKTE